MNWTNEPYKMICGSADAEKRVYKKLIGKSGRIWLIAVQDNPADNIYVSANSAENKPGYRGFRGFAGRTLTFELEDGTTLDLQGPWATNSDALFNDTNYDVRDKYLTFGVIGLGRKYEHGMGVTITDVLYRDKDWVIGEFNRVEKIAQKIANELGKTVMKFSKSRGGSSCGQVSPDKADSKLADNGSKK